MSATKRKIKKIKYKLKYIFYREEILGRNILIACLVIGLFVLFINLKLKQGEKLPQIEETFDYQEVETPVSDTANWKIYKNDWYGFQVKYPEYLPKPTQKKATKSDKWEYNFEFRKDAADENPVAGFDISVYSVAKTKELENTHEFPDFKYELNENEICQFITGHLTEKENFLAEEIYIPVSDDCRNPAFFYTLTGDEYMYNIVPVLNDGVEKPVDMKKYAIDNFPEFFSAASSFNLVDIKRPKSQPVQKRVSAPMPVAAKKEGGRLVCAKKNDKPGMSKKGKKHHLDMECCLDPDEDPNPHCYYDPKKYGKYL